MKRLKSGKATTSAFISRALPSVGQEGGTDQDSTGLIGQDAENGRGILSNGALQP